jgi:hypothetical protein
MGPIADIAEIQTRKKKDIQRSERSAPCTRVCAKDNINEWGVGRSAVHAYGILDKKEKKAGTPPLARTRA